MLAGSVTVRLEEKVLGAFVMMPPLVLAEALQTVTVWFWKSMSSQVRAINFPRRNLPKTARWNSTLNCRGISFSS